VRIVIRHPGAVVVSCGAVAAAGVAVALGVRAGAIFAGWAAAGYLVERMARYRALPAVKRRRRLRARAGRLRRALAMQEHKMAATERRLSALPAKSRRREALTSRSSAIDGRMSATASTLRDVEWRLRQLRVPTFLQYLRHAF
jgi:hypothetical protein